MSVKLIIVVGSRWLKNDTKRPVGGREKLSSHDPNHKDFSQANPVQTGTIYRKVQIGIIQDVSHVKKKMKQTSKVFI